MLNAAFEILLEVVLGGTEEAIHSPNVPVAMRILLVGLILLFPLGVFGWLLWSGIRAGNILRVLIAIAFLAGAVVLAFYRVRQFRKQNS